MTPVPPGKDAMTVHPPLRSLVVRPLRGEDDLRAIEWEGQYAHLRRVYAEVYRRMLAGEACMWVAERPAVGLVGQAFALLRSLRPDLADGQTRAYIFAVRVRPAWRGQGIGTRLMDALEDDLRQRGFVWATLLVARDNLRARVFYERRGYRVVGPDPGRWHYTTPEGRVRRVVEPSWRMQKTL